MGALWIPSRRIWVPPLAALSLRRTAFCRSVVKAFQRSPVKARGCGNPCGCGFGAGVTQANATARWALSGLTACTTSVCHSGASDIEIASNTPLSATQVSDSVDLWNTSICEFAFSLSATPDMTPTYAGISGNAYVSSGGTCSGLDCTWTSGGVDADLDLEPGTTVNCRVARCVVQAVITDSGNCQFGKRYNLFVYIYAGGTEYELGDAIPNQAESGDCDWDNASYGGTCTPTVLAA